MEADETGTIARQKAHRAELVDPEIAAHGGRIVKTTGDGMLVEFGSVVDATECAVAIQRAMAEREAEVGKKRRIKYRVGIYLGRNWTPSITALWLLLLQTTTFVPSG
jgi:class 3 adenylate cyclase